MKMFGQTSLGIVSLIAGVLLLYFFISGLNTNFNILFLILSIILVGIGAFLFLRVSKMANSISEPNLEIVPSESGSKLLEKNNKMIQDWDKTNTKRDNLKAVQMAAGAQAQSVKEQGA
jgi:hypothetical protein